MYRLSNNSHCQIVNGYIMDSTFGRRSTRTPLCLPETLSTDLWQFQGTRNPDPAGMPLLPKSGTGIRQAHPARKPLTCKQKLPQPDGYSAPCSLRHTAGETPRWRQGCVALDLSGNVPLKAAVRPYRRHDPRRSADGVPSPAPAPRRRDDATPPSFQHARPPRPPRVPGFGCP